MVLHPLLPQPWNRQCHVLKLKLANRNCPSQATMCLHHLVRIIHLVNGAETVVVIVAANVVVIAAAKVAAVATEVTAVVIVVASVAVVMAAAVAVVTEVTAAEIAVATGAVIVVVAGEATIRGKDTASHHLVLTIINERSRGRVVRYTEQP